MKNLAKTHKKLRREDFDQLWQKALFVIDTNILCDLYRLPNKAKDDLIEILEKLRVENRLWLPFQAMLEFTFNRPEVIEGQKETFTKVKNIIQGFIDGMRYQKLEDTLAKLQLHKRHSDIDPTTFVNETLKKLLQAPIDYLTDFKKELSKAQNKLPNLDIDDPVLNKINQLFEDRIGSGFNKEELENIYQEGEIRYSKNIPPGYKDAYKENKNTEGQHSPEDKEIKPDFRLFEDKVFLRKFGDLILWKELIRKAKADHIQYIILLTSDSKEDWRQQKNGKPCDPRYELLNELYFHSPSTEIFYIYNLDELFGLAPKYLQVSVAPESRDQVKYLAEVTKDDGKERTQDWVIMEGQAELHKYVVSKVAALSQGIKVFHVKEGPGEIIRELHRNIEGSFVPYYTIQFDNGTHCIVDKEYITAQVLSGKIILP